MCGICGAVGYEAEERTKEEILYRMMNAVRHRGPDGSDKHISDDVMLGFQRLSIIDENSGMRPMWNEDKTIALVFNGEIYNFKSLRRELEKEGHIFYSKSDSGVLLHGYEECIRNCRKITDQSLSLIFLQFLNIKKRLIRFGLVSIFDFNIERCKDY